MDVAHGQDVTDQPRWASLPALTLTGTATGPIPAEASRGLPHAEQLATLLHEHARGTGLDRVRWRTRLRRGLAGD